LAHHKPKETAGFKWQPEICPIAYAIVRRDKPNASETPRKPKPKKFAVSGNCASLGNTAASTALPQPPNTNQNVPMNSAIHRFVSDIVVELLNQSKLKQSELPKYFIAIVKSALNTRALNTRALNTCDVDHERCGLRAMLIGDDHGQG
jgi:hypothetical protein